MTQILNGAFIGTMNDAKSRFFQTKNRISHILCTVPKAEPVYPNRYQWKLIPLILEGSTDSINWLDVAASFIYHAQENGTGILIHDFKGDSRSVAVFIAYLMKFGNYKCEDALNQILEKKKKIILNPNYQKIMKDYEKEMYEKKNNSGSNIDSLMSSKTFSIQSRPRSYHYSHHSDINLDRVNKDCNQRYSESDQISLNHEDQNSNKRVATVHLDNELINDDNEEEFRKTSPQFSEVKGITKQKYANIVYRPAKNFLAMTDEGRSKYCTGKFLQNCNKFDKNLRENPKERFLDFEAPELNDDDLKIVKSHRDRVYDKYNPEEWPDREEVPDNESNRSLGLNGQAAAIKNIIGVVSKPFKTEYNHEFGGGRLNSDPRRELYDRWYVPELESKKLGHGINNSIFYKGKKNKHTGLSIDKENKHITDVYKKQLTKSISSNNKYFPIQSATKFHKTYDNYNQLIPNMNKEEIKPVLYNTSKNEEIIPYEMKMHLSACDTFKNDPTIGHIGGGQKCIRVFSGMMGKRSVAPKTAFKGNCIKQIIYNRSQNPKGYAGQPGEYLMADVPHINQKASFEVLPERRNSSAHHGIRTADRSGRSVDLTYKPHFDKSDNEQMNNKTSAFKQNHSQKINNPFVLKRPKSSIALKGDINGGFRNNNFANFDSKWTKFCRGKLSQKAYLTCCKCNFVLCKQADVSPHTFQWYKGSNQERNQTGFLEDDNDGGLAGTYSRLKPRIDTEPRECNSIFLKRPEWMRFYTINNGSHVGCPQCKVNVGVVKLSGLKCSCGHWNVPGYQLLRKNVKLHL